MVGNQIKQGYILKKLSKCSILKTMSEFKDQMVVSKKKRKLSKLIFLSR